MSAGFDGLSEQEKVNYVRQLQGAANEEIMVQIVQSAKKKCFKICVDSPGREFTHAEQKCLAQCTDRFNEARKIVAHTVSRLSKQREQQRQQV